MLKERLRLPLYDTNDVSAGAIAAGTTYYFFQSALSATKTILKTNSTTNGQMPYDKMTIVGLRLYLYTITNAPVTAADANLLLNNAVLIYKREDREILKVPCHWIPAGIGLNIGGQATYGGNGVPALTNIYRCLPETYVRSDRLQVEIQLVNGVTFAADISIEVMLEGVVDKKF